MFGLDIHKEIKLMIGKKGQTLMQIIFLAGYQFFSEKTFLD